jgi:type IV secretory pathway VirB4 component
MPEGFSGINHPSGIYLGKCVNTGGYINYDNFIGPPILSNQMMGIFGIAGAGKSVLLKLIAARGVAIGEWIIVFDIEGEFKELIETLLGGQYIDIKPGEKTGINPFNLEVDNEGRIDIYGKVGEIRENINLFCSQFRESGLDESEIIGIENSVMELYSERGITRNKESLFEQTEDKREGSYSIGNRKKVMPIYSDLKKKLYSKGLNKLADLMAMITGEGSLSIFDCQSTIELKRGIVGIGMKNVSDQFLKFYSIVNMLSWTWSIFGDYKYKNINKRVIIDEGWFFVKYPHAVEYLEEIERRGRKYRISLTIASHFIGEFLRSESGKVILEMSSTKIIMQQNSDSKDEIRDYFGLSENVARTLSSFEAGDCILLSGNKKAIMHVEPFSFEESLIFTGGRD